MNRRILESLAVAAAIACALFTSETASACDWGYCGEPAHLIPENKATVPANASLVWSPLVVRGEVDDAAAELVLTDSSGNEVDVQIDEIELPRFNSWGPTPRVVTPLESLDPGTEYTLSTPSTECSEGGEAPVESVFAVSDSEPIPNSLGTITASTLERVDMQLAEDGECWHTQDVISTDIELALDAEAQPWADALAYETVVDGEFWAPSHSSGQGFPIGSSWVGRGRDRVFAICNDDPYSEHAYLLPGTHTVKLRAYLPGTDIVLESNELTLDLDCTKPDGAPAIETEDPLKGGTTGNGQSSEAGNGASGSEAACSTGRGRLPGAVLLMTVVAVFAQRRTRRG